MFIVLVLHKSWVFSFLDAVLKDLCSEKFNMMFPERVLQHKYFVPALNHKKERADLLLRTKESAL
jgi:hypothetical protein